MSLVTSMIILFSLLSSTLVSIFMMKKRNLKWFSLLTAFCINTIVLVTSSWILYSLDEEEQIFGDGSSGFYILLIFIPVVTWLNFFILELVRNRKISTRY